MIDETRANDTSTMSDGLNLDGWFALPEKCSLVKNSVKKPLFSPLGYEARNRFRLTRNTDVRFQADIFRTLVVDKRTIKIG